MFKNLASHASRKYVDSLWRRRQAAPTTEKGLYDAQIIKVSRVPLSHGSRLATTQMHSCCLRHLSVPPERRLTNVKSSMSAPSNSGRFMTTLGAMLSIGCLAIGNEIIALVMERPFDISRACNFRGMSVLIFSVVSLPLSFSAIHNVGRQRTGSPSGRTV